MRHVSLWKSDVCRYCISLLEGIFCISAGSLCIALLLLTGSIPAQVLIWLMHILWGVSAFFTARRAGLHGRRHGIQTGFLCSLLLCMLLFTGGMLLHEPLTKRFFIRCLLMFPAGIAGGIIGVNTRLRKPPY